MAATAQATAERVGARSRLASPRAALALSVLAVLSLLAALPLAGLVHQFTSAGVLAVALMAPFAAVGSVIARREPLNPIGWMLLGSAAIFAICTDAGLYAVLALHFRHGGLPAVRLAVALTPFGYLALILLIPLPILLFPSGHLHSPGWRWPLRAYLATWSVVLVSFAITDSAAFTERRLVVDSSGQVESLAHTTGWFAAILSVASPAYGVLTLSFVVAAVLAYRRSTGERRQQLKWLMAGGTICVVGVTTALLGGQPHSVWLVILTIVGFFGPVALPVAIGIGILKYRLYDIDRLISRTLSYAVVTGLLVGVFTGVVVLTTDLLPFSSPVGVAASTLSAAALFNPLRRRVQRFVDRRFNRARYDAEAIVSAFSARLRDAVDLETVNRELVQAVQRAIEPAHATVWIRQA